MKTMTKNKIAIAILAAAVLLALGIFFNKSGSLNLTGGSTVAKVNGQKINDKKLEERLRLSLEVLNTGGVSVEEEQYEDFRKEVLNNLINEILIADYAQENNIEASQEELDKEYQSLIFFYRGEENLQKELETFQVSSDQFWQNLEKNVVFRKSVESFVGPGSTATTEEEILETYEVLEAEAKKANLEADLPSFNEAREWLAVQLRNQKVTEQAPGFMSHLREGAEIEIFI
jgi:peptidyl-prolyl cis-trans isomerase D